MITGMVIGFLVWAFIVIVALVNQEPWETLNVSRSLFLAFFIVGTGACIGYLFS